MDLGNIAGVDRSIDYINEYRPSCEDSLYLLSNSIICTSQVNNYSYGLAKGHTFLGYHYYFRSTLDSAITAFNTAREYAYKESHWDVLASASNGLGLVYSNLSYFDIALLYQQEYLEYARLIDDQKFQAEALSNIAALYFSLDKFEQQQLYLKKLEDLQITQDIFTAENMGWQIRAQGLTQISRGNKTEALKLFEEAMTIWRGISFDRGICRLFINLGQTYQSLSSIDSSIVNYTRAAELNKSVQSKEMAVTIDYETGMLYDRLGKYKEALFYISRAAKNAVSYNLYSRSKKCNLYLASIYANQGMEDKELEVFRNNNEWANAGRHLRERSLEIWVQYQNKILQNEKENAKLKIAESKYIKNIFYLISSLIVVALLGFITFRILTKRYKRTTLKNETLINQNEVISDKLYITQKEKKLLEITKTQLEEEKNSTTAELTKKIMNMANEKAMVTELAEKIRKLDISQNKRNDLLNVIKASGREGIWDELDIQLSTNNELFFAKLASISDKLTSNDYRLSAYIKMQLSTKDIARITSKSTDSIKMAKSRLRKKLHVSDSQIKLESFFNKIAPSQTK